MKGAHVRGKGLSPGAGERRPGSLAALQGRLAQPNIAGLAERREVLRQNRVAHLHYIADRCELGFLHSGEEGCDLQSRWGVERRVQVLLAHAAFPPPSWAR